jgi:hypothetical protein
MNYVVNDHIIDYFIRIKHYELLYFDFNLDFLHFLYKNWANNFLFRMVNYVIW